MSDSPRDIGVAYVILSRKLGDANAPDVVIGHENDLTRAIERVQAGREADNGHWFWMRTMAEHDRKENLDAC